MDGNLQSLKDELKEKDDKLVGVIKKCSELEGNLFAKDDDLEARKGVLAKCIDLHSQLASLRDVLEHILIRSNDLCDVLSRKITELERTE